jgi:hypothetical protein
MTHGRSVRSARTRSRRSAGSARRAKNMLSMRREVVSEVHHLVVGEADAVDRAGDEPGDDVVARLGSPGADDR